MSRHAASSQETAVAEMLASNGQQAVREVANDTKSYSSQKEKPVVAKQTGHSSQKRPTSGFATTGKEIATTGGKFATGDLVGYGSEGAVPFVGVDGSEWRIVFRIMPPKKDGTQTISFYYKGRTSYVNKQGKRKVPYLTGGKITDNGTKEQLRTLKKRHSADN